MPVTKPFIEVNIPHECNKIYNITTSNKAEKGVHIFHTTHCRPTYQVVEWFHRCTFSFYCNPKFPIGPVPLKSAPRRIGCRLQSPMIQCIESRLPKIFHHLSRGLNQSSTLHCNKFTPKQRQHKYMVGKAHSWLHVHLLRICDASSYFLHSCFTSIGVTA